MRASSSTCWFALVALLAGGCALAPLPGDVNYDIEYSMPEVDAADPGVDHSTDTAGVETASDPAQTDPAATDTAVTDPGDTLADPGTEVADPAPDQAVDPAEDPAAEAVDVATVVPAETQIPTCCSAVVQCLKGCTTGDYQTCADNCEATNTTTEAAHVLGACLHGQACFGQADLDACMASKCKDQASACAASCTDILSDCVSMRACENGCPADNPATTTVDEYGVCFAACDDRSTVRAFADDNALTGCLNQKCTSCGSGGATCDRCKSDSEYGTCKDAWKKCAPAGSQDCVDAFLCSSSGCPDPGACDSCLSGATFDAQVLLYPLLMCIHDACAALTGTDYDKCKTDARSGTCKSLYDACKAG